MLHKHIFNVVAYYHQHKVGNSKRHQNLQCILFFLFLAILSDHCQYFRCSYILCFLDAVIPVYPHIYHRTVLSWVSLLWSSERYSKFHQKSIILVSRSKKFIVVIFSFTHTVAVAGKTCQNACDTAERLSDFTATPPIPWCFDTRFRWLVVGAVNLMWS